MLLLNAKDKHKMDSLALKEDNNNEMCQYSFVYGWYFLLARLITH